MYKIFELARSFLEQDNKNCMRRYIIRQSPHDNFLPDAKASVSKVMLF